VKDIKLFGPTLYCKHVINDVDLPAIKEALADFQVDGFTIDSDPEEADRFHNITLPIWYEASQKCNEHTEKVIQGLDSVHEAKESILSVHLHDDTCIGVSICSLAKNKSYHRYTSLHPDHRGNAHIYEFRILGMYWTFDVGNIDAFYYERPEGLPDWSNWSEKPVIGVRKSMARGTEQIYNERFLTASDWEKLKADPDFGFDESMFNFVVEDV
jgi:hypothetical protein